MKRQLRDIKKFGRLRVGYADEDVEFEDEMRLGTRTGLGRKRTSFGVRPAGRQKIGYKYLYLYVSLEPFTGEMFAMFLPRLNKECLASLLTNGVKL